MFGSPGTDRTYDTLINSQVQLPLCYWGIGWMRDQESNLDLELMRLLNYRYSIPR